MNIKREFLYSEDIKMVPFQLLTSNYGVVENTEAPHEFNEGPTRSKSMKISFPIESSNMAMLIDVGGTGDEIVEVKSSPPGIPEVELTIFGDVTYQVYIVSKEYVDGFVTVDFSSVQPEAIAGQRAEITYDNAPQGINLSQPGAMTESYGRDSGDTNQWYNYDLSYDGPLRWEAPEGFVDESIGGLPEVIIRRDVYQDLLSFFRTENLNGTVATPTQIVSTFKALNEVCTYISNNDNTLQDLLPESYEQIAALWEYVDQRVPSQNHATYVAAEEHGIHQYVSQAAVWTEILPIESPNYAPNTNSANAHFLDPDCIAKMIAYDSTTAGYKPKYKLDSELYGAINALTKSSIAGVDGNIQAGEAEIGIALKTVFSDAHAQFDDQFNTKTLPRLDEFGTNATNALWWTNIEQDAHTFTEVYDEIVVRLESADEVLGAIDWYLYLPSGDTGGGDDGGGDDDDDGGGDDGGGTGYGTLVRPDGFTITKEYDVHTKILNGANRNNAAYGHSPRNWRHDASHAEVRADIINGNAGFHRDSGDISVYNAFWAQSQSVRNAHTWDGGRAPGDQGRDEAHRRAYNFIAPEDQGSTTEVYDNNWIWDHITSPVPGQNNGEPWLPEEREDWNSNAALALMDLDGTEDIDSDSGKVYYLAFASYVNTTFSGRYVNATIYYYEYDLVTERITGVEVWNDIVADINGDLDSFYPPQSSNKSFPSTPEPPADKVNFGGDVIVVTSGGTPSGSDIRDVDDYYPVAHEATLQNIRFLKDLLNSMDENLWATFNTTSSVILSLLLELKKAQDDSPDKYSVLNITNSTVRTSDIEIFYKKIGGGSAIETALSLANDWIPFTQPLLDIGDSMLILNLNTTDFDSVGKYIFQIRPKMIKANIYSATTGYMVVSDELNDYQDRGALFGYNAQVLTAEGHKKGEQKIVTDYRWKASQAYIKVSPIIVDSEIVENDKLELWSADFIPATIEIDIVEHNALTLSYAAYAKKELNTNSGMCTIYDHNGNVYKELSFGRHSNAGTGGDIVEYRIPAEKEYTDEY